MNVLHFASFLGDSGVAKVAVSLSNEMSELGINVTLVTDTNPEKIKFYPNCEVHVVNMTTSNSGDSIQKLPVYKKLLKIILGRVFFWFLKKNSFKARFLKSINDIEAYDIVFIHCLPGKIMLSEMQHKNIFYVVHNTKSKHLETGYTTSTLMNKLLFKKSLANKNLIAVSESVKYDLCYKLGFSEDKCRVIYNPFNFSKITSFKNKNTQDQSNVVLNELNIVTIGRLAEQKRYDRLIKAVYYLFQKKVNFKLFILGEGPLEFELKKLTNELGLKEHVHFKGFVDNPYSYLNNNTIFVLSSDFEGLPTVLIEAAICKCKIVTTPVAGAREILGDNYPYITTNFDPNEVGKLIHQISQTNNGYNYSNLDQFSASRVVNNYLSLYEKKC